MKHLTRFLLGMAVCIPAAAILAAAPLAKDTPVYASPDAGSATLVTLAAGTEPVPATSASAVAVPEGWQAVDVSVSNEVWVRDSDLNKELDIKPGSELRAEPKADAAVVGTMVAGSVTELRGIQGKWVQMFVTRKTTGYINPGAPAPAGVAVASAEPQPVRTNVVSAQPPPAQTVSTVPYAAQQTTAPAVQQPLSVSGGQRGAPVSGTATRMQTTPAQTGVPQPSATTHAAAPIASVGAGRTYEAKPVDPESVGAPRTFEGTFASTRRAFAPRRPYEFQLTGPDGSRYAYLDLSKVVVTSQFESYVGSFVVVNGAIAPVPDTKDIVIKVETIQKK